MEELRETLVARLRERGVGYLAPSDAVATTPIASEGALLIALLEQPDSCLRLAMIPLLIRHPGLAGEVAVLVNQIEPGSAFELANAVENTLQLLFGHDYTVEYHHGPVF
jgi:hypothetical protein